jgi:hypothetical protein
MMTRPDYVYLGYMKSAPARHHGPADSLVLILAGKLNLGATGRRNDDVVKEFATPTPRCRDD